MNDKAKVHDLNTHRMPTPAELFLQQAENPHIDPSVAELRRGLSQAKRDALTRAEGLDEPALQEIMPELYRQIISTTIQIAARVGVSVCLALEALDEQTTEVSISSFPRLVREQMTATGIAMKNRHSSPLAKLVAEVEACRLAWRHNHEFLSWLAFRREDPRYSPEDRRARLQAFKVQPRLLQAREGVTKALGPELAAALESHDRFLLANRWRLSDSPEHAVERFVWPLLSYQRSEHVLVETARYEYDAMVGMQVPKHDLEIASGRIILLLREELAAALRFIPDVPLLHKFSG